MFTTSNHFQIEPLTDGVYAALSREHGAALSNAGIIDLGDRALVFDLLGTPQAARDLIDTAIYLTKHPVMLGINSHWHPDHVLGNQELPATATLISTPRTRELIGSRMGNHISRERQRIPRQLRQLEEQFAHETDIATRIEINEQVAFLRMISHDMASLSARQPNLTFEHSMVLHGPARSVVLLSFGSGHTESDTILYLPDDQIVFVGDLLFHERHPWLGDGDPDAWLRTYDRIEAIDAALDVIVPGHGTIATLDAFAALRRYVPALRQLVTEIKQTGGSVEDAAQAAVPAAFSTWAGVATFQNNMRYLYEHAPDPAPQA